MPDTPIAQPVENPQAVIADDLSCVICGYNLRGLRFTGRCPECGSAIERSTHGDLLKYADTDWLGRVFLGVRLVLWGILIMILVRLATAIGGGMGIPRSYFVSGALVQACLDLLAAFLITVQEPKIALSEDPVT
jgi:hypothetical protein